MKKRNSELLDKGGQSTKGRFALEGIELLKDEQEEKVCARKTDQLRGKPKGESI